jgi:small conductance mechanosensitive channel
MPRSLRRSLPPIVLGALVLLAGVSALATPPARAQLPGPLGDVAGGGAEEDPPPEGEGEEETRRGFFPTAPPEEILLTREMFDPRSWPDLGWRFLARLIDWLPSLLAALLVLVAFFVLHRVVAGILRRLMSRTRADPAAHEIAARLARYAILGLGLVMAASQLGINVGSLLAGIGILGLAIGLAAQESLSNLVAGITILWDRPFRIGDHVTVSGTFGKVQEIGLRATRIRTVEHLDAILPNKEIINQTIVNHTLNPMIRLGIPLGIAYQEDTREARRVLLEAVQGHELLLDKPEPKVVVTALAESSVDLELRVWLRDPYMEREATFEMIELAKIALDEAGIEIPFPQRTLHLPEGLRVVGARERDDLDEGAREPGG